MAEAGEDVGHAAGSGGRPPIGRTAGPGPDPAATAQESRWLDRLLLPRDAHASPDAPTVCVLTGPAGSGKTELVLRWAAAARGRFPDGHLYADLRAGHPDGPAPAVEVLDRFLRALGVPEAGLPRDPDRKGLLYRSLLTDRGMLIVLDDAAGDAQVRPLLPPPGDCVVIVTGRPGLTVRGAHHRAASGSSPDVPAAPASANADAAVADGRAGCGYAGPDGALAATYQALAAPLRGFLRLLGLHPGPEISPAAAAALAGQPVAHIRPLLDGLCAAGLVEPLPAEPARFRLRERVQPFAVERAWFEERAGDVRLARRRVLQWYLHGSYLAGRFVELDSHRALDLSFSTVRHEPPAIADRQAARDWFDREWANLLCAIGTAAEHGFPDVVWQLSATLRYAHLWADRVDAALAVQRIALASARRQRNRHAEAVALDSLTVLLTHAGALEEAADHNLSAVALWHLQGERLREATARLIQMRVLIGRRDWPHAIPLGWGVVGTAEQLGDGRLEAAALGLLVECYTETRQYEEAQLLLHETVALERADPRAAGLADALWNTSRVLRAVGRPAAALGPARDALVQAELTADASRQARGLLELALVWQANGHDEKALATFQRATARARAGADRGGEARALHAVAGYHRRHGDLSAAHAFAERAVAIAREIGDRWQLAMSLEQAAGMLDRLDQGAAALRYRREAYALFEEFDEPTARQARRGLSAAAQAGRRPTLGPQDEREEPKRTVRDGGA